MPANQPIKPRGMGPPETGLNTVYLLWATTMLGATLAGVILAVNVLVATLNGFWRLFSTGPIIPDVDHVRWLLIMGLFAALALVTHLIRRRSEGLSRRVIKLKFPDEIVAQTLNADSVLEKFECRGWVEINLYGPELEAEIRQDIGPFRDLLEGGLVTAISDPVIRYSKVKIEETLKESLGARVKLSDIASVSLITLSQKRIPVEPPAAAAEGSEKSGSAPSKVSEAEAGLSQAAPGGAEG